MYVVTIQGVLTLENGVEDYTISARIPDRWRIVGEFMQSIERWYVSMWRANLPACRPRVLGIEDTNSHPISTTE